VTTTLNYVEQVRAKLADLLPTCDPALLDLYTLLALEFGPHTDLVMVHNAWSVWQNRTNPGHRSLIPFPYLAPEVQELDRKYMEAIHAASEVSG
jgi:hypothetical protein